MGAVNKSLLSVTGSVFDVFTPILEAASVGYVLDVATGTGDFVNVLMKCLPGYKGIIGIDISAHAVQTAQNTLDQDDIHFTQMDGACMGFEDDFFEVVNMSVSLHHLPNISQALAEMKRVLKPGGHCVISEMCRDVQTEAQLTQVYIHHWAAEIDTARGVTHNRTLTRGEILDALMTLDLEILATYEYTNPEADPKDETTIQNSEAAIDKVLQRASGLADFQTFSKRGEALRQRLHAVGTQMAPVLIAIAGK